MIQMHHLLNLHLNLTTMPPRAQSTHEFHGTERNRTVQGFRSRHHGTTAFYLPTPAPAIGAYLTVVRTQLATSNRARDRDLFLATSYSFSFRDGTLSLHPFLCILISPTSYSSSFLSSSHLSSYSYSSLLSSIGLLGLAQFFLSFLSFPLFSSPFSPRCSSSTSLEVLIPHFSIYPLPPARPFR